MLRDLQAASADAIGLDKKGGRLRDINIGVVRRLVETKVLEVLFSTS